MFSQLLIASLMLFAAFAVLFVINSYIIAENAVHSAKCQEKFTPSPITWVTSVITLGAGLGAVLLFVRELFGMPDAVMLLLLVLFVVIGAWMGMLRIARRIVERYYPHVIFHKDADLGIETLGTKRPGEGWIMDLY